jgi:hypothetical protein
MLANSREFEISLGKASMQRCKDISYSVHCEQASAYSIAATLNVCNSMKFPLGVSRIVGKKE